MRRFEEQSITFSTKRSIPLSPTFIQRLYQRHNLRKGLSSKSIRQMHQFIEMLGGNLLEASARGVNLGIPLTHLPVTPTVRNRVLDAFSDEGFIKEVRRGYYFPQSNLEIPSHDITRLAPHEPEFNIFDPRRAQISKGWAVIMRQGNFNWKIRENKDENKKLITFARDFQKRVNYPIRRMVRIYNGNENRGGRIYSNYQIMRREHRSKLLIDSLPTVEIDYKYNHMKMIFALAGVDPEGDPYTGFSIPRSQAKKALNVLVNSTNPVRVWCDKRWSSPFRWTKQEAERFLTEVYRRYPVLEKFHGSGIGLYLQKLEGDIALEIMSRAHRQNKVVLPVHDAFISRADDKEWLENIMAEVWDEVVTSAMRQNKSFLEFLPLLNQ